MSLQLTFAPFADLVEQTRQSAPIVLVAFTSAVDPDTRLKESKIDVTLADLTCNLTADLDWIEEVAAFAKAPEGVS